MDWKGAPKGTFDILPEFPEEVWQASHLWQWVEEICRETAREYGFQEIRTPIYEHTQLFSRGVGETSDIVTKEMFTFQDRGDRSISLRPEGTSSVLRAFLEHHLEQKGGVHRFFYLGPMFRYERPQSGRYRQHHQFGIEVLGVEGPEQDVEVIDLLLQVYRKMGLKGLKVHVNTVGDIPSRLAYREALQDFLRPHLGDLSADSQTRFGKNPLRILDSKDPQDRKILQQAPSILQHLSQEAKQHFQQVCALLDQLHIPYCVDDRIVRGLDYYQKTVFECIATDSTAAQNTIGAGGRYDGLVETFGGPNLPAVGFATGLERILQTALAQNVPLPSLPSVDLYFVPIGEAAKNRAIALATLCRHKGISTIVEMRAKKLSSALQNGVRHRAKYIAILGEEELQREEVQLKCTSTREQRAVPFSCLVEVLRTGSEPRR